MNVLVDTSVWIDYFRDGRASNHLDYLIQENLVVVNDLILAELLPLLRIKRKMALIKALNAVQRSELSINWNEVIELQIVCLKNGINKVGIPDLIIVQNAITSRLPIYTLDKHFTLIAQHTKLRLCEN